MMLAALIALTLAAQEAPGSGAPDPVAHAARPASDRARDVTRKPYEILDFAGVRAGWRVGEYMPGAGYFTRVLAERVGPAGRVWAYQPEEIIRLRPAFLTEIEAVAGEPAHLHVSVLTGPTRSFQAPEALDLVFTAQNYHDLYGPYAAAGTGAAFDQAVFAALEPGGVYLIVDHHAAAGTGLAGASALHRIEKAAVIRAVTAAGFEFEAESEILLSGQDDLAKDVFDPVIRGRTSQFVLRFRKPA